MDFPRKMVLEFSNSLAISALRISRSARNVTYGVTEGPLMGDPYASFFHAKNTAFWYTLIHERPETPALDQHLLRFKGRSQWISGYRAAGWKRNSSNTTRDSSRASCRMANSKRPVYSRSQPLPAVDLDKAIANRAEWRAEQRHWCRKGRLPKLGCWSD